MIGVISNPYASKNRNNGYDAKLLEEIVGRNGIVRISEKKEDLCSVIDEFYAKGVDTIVCDGGDGTLQSVLTSAVKKYEKLPGFAILPNGATNALATNLNAYAYKANDLLEKIVRGQASVCARSSLCVNGEYGFIFATGLMNNFYDKFYDGSDYGLGKAAKIILKTAISAVVNGAYSKSMFAPLEMRIVTDGAELPWKEYNVVAASTITSFGKIAGIVLRPFYRANKGLFFHFIASRMNCKESLACLHMLVGKRVCNKKLFDVGARTVVLIPKRPSGYMIDGELKKAEEKISISLGPRINLLH